MSAKALFCQVDHDLSHLFSHILCYHLGKKNFRIKENLSLLMMLVKECAPYGHFLFQ